MASVLVNVVAGAAIVWGLVVGGLYLGQRRILFVPDQSLPDRARAGVTDMEAVRLGTEDGLTLLSWFAPARTGRPTIVYFHGNGGHIGYRGTKARALLDLGYGVLLVGYRGYGGNPGRPSEAGFAADARAALTFLDGRGVAASTRVLYGESLGSGVAVSLAAEIAAVGRPAAAVVLEAPFESVVDEASRRYWYVPVRQLVHDRFASVERIGRIAAPLLVVHGERDTVIPAHAGEALYGAASDPKRLVLLPTAGHNDLLDHGLIGIVDRFLVEQKLAR